MITNEQLNEWRVDANSVVDGFTQPRMRHATRLISLMRDRIEQEDKINVLTQKLAEAEQKSRETPAVDQAFFDRVFGSQGATLRKDF